MVHLSKVATLIVSLAVAVSGANMDRKASQDSFVNLDLIEADADFERLLGGTHYGSYSYNSDKTRGIKGAKSYGDDGGKGGKKAKSYDYYDSHDPKGSKYTYHEDKGSKGKGAKGYNGDDDGKGKGGKKAKSYDYYGHYDDYEDKGSTGGYGKGKGYKGYGDDGKGKGDKKAKSDKKGYGDARHDKLEKVRIFIWLEPIHISLWLSILSFNHTNSLTHPSRRSLFYFFVILNSVPSLSKIYDFPICKIEMKWNTFERLVIGKDEHLGSLFRSRNT